jgi:hypothetical protein
LRIASNRIGDCHRKRKRRAAASGLRTAATLACIRAA